MKYIKRIAVLLIVVIMSTAMLTGCREADMVSYNVGREADNFNVVRRITVFNTRTDTVLLQMTGKFSIHTDADDDLNIICELDDNTYAKHYVHLSDETTYTVEDLSGADVTQYAYELNFLPQQLPGVKIVHKK